MKQMFLIGAFCICMTIGFCGQQIGVDLAYGPVLIGQMPFVFVLIFVVVQKKKRLSHWMFIGTLAFAIHSVVAQILGHHFTLWFFAITTAFTLSMLMAPRKKE